MVSEKSINDLIRCLVDHFHPEQIILFGSYARGNATEDSDVDILVICDEVKNRFKLTCEIRAKVFVFPFPKDILVCTKEEYEKYKHIHSTIYAPIYKEGKVMYAKAS